MNIEGLIDSVILPEEIEKEFIEPVKKYYRDNSNYYHTIHHIRNCFKLFLDNKEEFDKEFNFGFEQKCPLLLRAIAYHDAFYIPGFTKNEEISASIYYTDWTTSSKPESISKDLYDDVELVQGLIMRTSINNHCYKHPYDKILHDLDWSGFIDYGVQLINSERIKAEYYGVCKILPSTENLIEYTQARIKFLKETRKRANDGFYKTKLFSQYNDIAWENIDKEINWQKEQLEYLNK